MQFHISQVAVVLKRIFLEFCTWLPWVLNLVYDGNQNGTYRSCCAAVRTSQLWSSRFPPSAWNLYVRRSWQLFLTRHARFRSIFHDGGRNPKLSKTLARKQKKSLNLKKYFYEDLSHHKVP